MQRICTTDILYATHGGFPRRHIVIGAHLYERENEYASVCSKTSYVEYRLHRIQKGADPGCVEKWCSSSSDGHYH